MNTEKMREARQNWLRECDAPTIAGAFKAGAKWQAARAGGDGEAVAWLIDDGFRRRVTEHEPTGTESRNATPLYTAPPAPAAKKDMTDDIEQSFHAWVLRNCPPGNYINLFRGAHSAGYWDGQESVAPDYEQAPAAKVPEPPPGFVRLAYKRDPEEWLYLNHADTWQHYQGPVTQPPEQAVPDALHQRLIDLLRSVGHHGVVVTDEGQEYQIGDREIEEARNLYASLSAAPTPEGES